MPTLDTASSIAATFREAMTQVEVLAPPVPTTPELVLLAVLGAGAVMVVVDTLAVVLRKVAVSGLPLLVLFAVPSAVLPGGIGLVAFVLGAAGWLGLLLADSSDRVARWGTPLRSARASSTDPSLGRVGRRIGGAALGIALVVPVLVPGLDGRLLGGNGTGSGLGGSRTTTTYNPLTELAGQLSQPIPQDLLTYRTTEGADYLRLTTLDLFDPDSGWSSSELSADFDEDRVQGGDPAPAGPQRPRRRGRDRDRPEAAARRPVAAGAGRPVDDRHRGPVAVGRRRPRPSSRRGRRSATSTSRTRSRPPGCSPTSGRCARRSRCPAASPTPTRSTPSCRTRRRRSSTTSPRARPPSSTASPRLQTFFRDTDFRYDVETGEPSDDAPDALTAFLRNRRGFCEQFASAMAALVRGAGIPARVAVGFITGDRDGDEYTVTTDEAHAWPEVWFQDVGWVRFEPTPRYDDVDVDVPDYSVAPPEQDDAATPSAAPSAAPAAPQTGPSAAPGAIDRGADGGLTGDAGGELDQGPSAWWLLVPATLALLGVPALLAAVRRRRRWRSPDALGAWASVTDDAVDVGHRWRPADSPRTAAAHLLSVRHLPDDATEALLRLAAGAERARYARSAPPADAAALRADATSVRAALLAGAAPRERWLARLLPVSTVASTSARLGTAVADVLDRFDVLVSAVGAKVRHPRTRAKTG